MADGSHGRSSSGAEEEIAYNVTSLQLKEAGITVENGKLKWSNDYESLQSFIESTFKLKGKWSRMSRKCNHKVLYKLHFAVVPRR
jgi:hypothetical protein